MTARNYAKHDCPIAQTLSTIGDQWTILIVRDALRGRRRFAEFQESLGISRNLLARRLKEMVAAGLLEKTAQPGGRRHIYQPTEKCRDLQLVLLALAGWGERWRDDPDGTHLSIRHRPSGADVGLGLLRLDTGASVPRDEITVTPRRAKT